MVDKKTIMLTALIAVFASVITGIVAYAALTQRLDIKGSAEFVPETWQVNFKASSLSNAIITGGATVTNAPIFSDTIIKDYLVVLTKPGDSIAYTFDLENTGTLDAKLTSFALGAPICTGTTGETKADDEAIVCSDNLTYTLKYVSGDLASNNLTAGNSVAVNDMLKKATSVKVELKLNYANEGILPYASVAIDGLDTYLIYSSQ